jgi:hypothetical protein
VPRARPTSPCRVEASSEPAAMALVSSSGLSAIAPCRSSTSGRRPRKARGTTRRCVYSPQVTHSSPQPSESGTPTATRSGMGVGRGGSLHLSVGLTSRNPDDQRLTSAAKRHGGRDRREQVRRVRTSEDDKVSVAPARAGRPAARSRRFRTQRDRPRRGAHARDDRRPGVRPRCRHRPDRERHRLRPPGCRSRRARGALRDMTRSAQDADHAKGRECHPGRFVKGQ